MEGMAIKMAPRSVPTLIVEAGTVRVECGDEVLAILRHDPGSLGPGESPACIHAVALLACEVLRVRTWLLGGGPP